MVLDGASRGKGACIKFKIFFFSRKALGHSLLACLAIIFTFLNGRMGEWGTFCAPHLLVSYCQRCRAWTASFSNLGNSITVDLPVNRSRLWPTSTKRSYGAAGATDDERLQMKMRRARYWRHGASSPALSREQPPLAVELLSAAQRVCCGF